MQTISVKIQKNEILSPDKTSLVRYVDVFDETYKYEIEKTPEGDYRTTGRGVPEGFECKSIAKVRRICDLLAEEYYISDLEENKKEAQSRR